MDYPAETRRKMAKDGRALPDGSFPINNASDLRNAISLLGHAKNKARARRHIIANARRLGLLKALPGDWKIQEGLLGRFKEVLHPRDRGGRFSHKPGSPEHKAEAHEMRGHIDSTAEYVANHVAKDGASDHSRRAEGHIAAAREHLAAGRHMEAEHSRHAAIDAVQSGQEAAARKRHAETEAHYKREVEKENARRAALTPAQRAAEDDAKDARVQAHADERKREEERKKRQRAGDDRRRAEEDERMRRRHRTTDNLSTAISVGLAAGSLFEAEGLAEADFDPTEHLRDRSGRFRTMALGLRGHQLMPHVLPKPSKLPEVHIRRSKPDPAHHGPTEFTAHEVLPGLALHSDGDSHRVFHIATGLPVGPNMYGSRKSVVEQVRGALGHVDWSNPDQQAYVGSEEHKRASQILDAAVGAHFASRRYGYKDRPEAETDKEAINFLRSRGRMLEGDPQKTYVKPTQTATPEQMRAIRHGDIQRRIAALAAFRQMGEGYDRSVATHLSDAERMLQGGRVDEAQHWIERAEQSAEAARNRRALGAQRRAAKEANAERLSKLTDVQLSQRIDQSMRSNDPATAHPYRVEQERRRRRARFAAAGGNRIDQ